VTRVYVAWGIAAAILAIAACAVGAFNGRGLFGILIDSRNRYSLTNLQIVLWTLVIISLIAGFSIGRGDLEFTIPDELLVVLGISAGSATVATVAKGGKDAQEARQLREAEVAVAAGEAPPPQRLKILRNETSDDARFSEMFLVDEGSDPGVVDVSKFQNFWITLLLVAAYVALAVDAIEGAATTADLKLPEFNATFVTLLGISHAAYVAGKLPNRA
jgi:hypothetical protein